jgi:hypothetical protein
MPSYRVNPDSERSARRGYLNHWEILARQPEEMADRRGFQKKRPKIKKTETTRWKKGRRTSTEKRIRKEWQGKSNGPKMKGVSNPLCSLCNTDISVDHILWECKKKPEDQRMNMDMRKEEWINGKKGMEKIHDYAKEIGLYNGTEEWKNNEKISKIIARRKRTIQYGDENGERRRKTNEDADGL